MSDLRTRARRELTWAALGTFSDDELAHAVVSHLTSAARTGDPQVLDVAAELVGDPVVPVPVLGAIAVFVHYERVPESPGATPGDVRAVLTERITTCGDDSQAVDLITALPRPWLTPAMVERVVHADLDLPHRLAANADLLPAAVHLLGQRSAMDKLVHTHLCDPSAGTWSLLQAAYDLDGLPQEDIDALEHAVSRLEGGPTHGLAATASRMSVYRQDAAAADLARQVRARPDAGPHDLPVAGLVLWLAGDHDAGVGVANQTPVWNDELGWGTQATRSLTAFLNATTAPPEQVVHLLAYPTHPERPGRSIATVGALVARLAWMRAQAYRTMGDLTWAGLEADAAARYAGYRGYQLHTQSPGQEFGVAVCDRLALTAPERAAATDLASHAAGCTAGMRLDLSDGVLHRVPAPDAS